MMIVMYRVVALSIKFQQKIKAMRLFLLFFKLPTLFQLKQQAKSKEIIKLLKKHWSKSNTALIIQRLKFIFSFVILNDFV
ncbi:hypothetical protein XA39_09010 [Acinetobacter tandoii]|mgnify:CR=1 FL=1|nr:hypothetical protein XA39_09010 [Acinetobacter tandoii]